MQNGDTKTKGKVRWRGSDLRRMVNLTPQMLMIMEPNGRITWANRLFLEYFGIRLGRVDRKQWLETYIHPKDLDGFIGVWKSCMATGKPFEHEARLHRADGEYRWNLVRAVPLRDEQGEILKWYGIDTDIEDQKRAEQALRQSEAYLAEAQRLSHTGSWAFDLASGKFVYASEECRRMYEVEAQEALPTREATVRLIHPEDRDSVQASFEKSVREKVDTSTEFRLVLPSGTVKHVHAIRHPVMNDAGDIVQVVGTSIDITERKRAEKERERLRQLEAELAHINRVSMMGELAASIAHEVNQPLAGIVSNGGACLRWLAVDPPDAEEVREAIRDIVRDGKRAGEVIARIRALTKRTAPPKEELDLNEIAREVLALVGDEAKERSVITKTDFAADLSPISGDRVQLQQVVLNLVMNGIEAMSEVDDRARELTITTGNTDTDQVLVSVADSGIGLDPNTMARIFEPFYTTKPSGMGMGLSISRSILQNHGGRLWAAANDGPGATFHFTLPKYQGEEQNAEAARA